MNGLMQQVLLLSCIKRLWWSTHHCVYTEYSAKPMYPPLAYPPRIRKDTCQGSDRGPKAFSAWQVAAAGGPAL